MASPPNDPVHSLSGPIASGCPPEESRTDHVRAQEQESTTRPAPAGRQARAGRWQRLDSPALTAAAAAVAGTVYVIARLLVVAKGDITRFVMAGQDFVNPATAPRGLHVFTGSGYDGQFYYRLALDPLNLSRTAYGITLDAGFRVQRIGLSVLSWLAAGGQRSLVPDSEVAVNLAALAVLAWLGALIARDAGRHAAWGLLVAGFWGFVFSIGRDLPEVVASCLLVGGLLAMRRDRPVAAGLLFAGAVLTLETTLDVVIAVGLVCVVELVRRRRRPGTRDLAWVVPGAAFVGWQLFGLAATGTLPMRADGGDNLGVPVVHMVGAIVYYLERLTQVGSLVWLGELFVLAVVTLSAAWCLHRSRVPLWEKLAWGIAVLVALSLSAGIWYGRANFRGFEDLYLLSTIVLLGSRRRLWIVAALVAVAWVVNVGHYVVAL